MEAFKTAFPPLLLGVRRHQERLRHTLHALTNDEVAPESDPDFAAWYGGEGSRLADAFQDGELREAWLRVGDLNSALNSAIERSVEFARRGDQRAVRQEVDRAFTLSGEMLELLVASSLRELAFALRSRQQVLSDRYERDLLEAAQVTRCVVRIADQRITECDTGFAALFNVKRQDVRNADARVLIGNEAFDRLASSAIEGRPQRVEIHLPQSDGEQRILELVAYATPPGDPEVLDLLVVDCTQAVQDAQQRKLLSTAIEASDQIVMITDALQRIVYVNPAFERVTGYKSSEVLGRSPHFLQGAATNPATRIKLREAIDSGRATNAEILNYRKNGKSYWVELAVVPVSGTQGEVSHWVAIQRDISERKLQEEEITRLAMEDFLTGLPNRRAAEARLAIEWNRARRESGTFAIAIADIDRFKSVNDTYGHHVGDLALAHVAKTLADNMRGGDWIARWGGEEFLICYHDLDSKGAFIAGERARKLVRSRPLASPQGDLPITLSMGISVYQGDVESMKDMIGKADSLLYEAKGAGRDRVMCTGAGTRRSKGVWGMTQVQAALNENRVLAAYQPIVDLRTGLVVADEALARIVTPDGTVIPAEQFIVAAESHNLVSRVDECVSSLALTQPLINSRQARFINLSSQFLADLDQVQELVAKVGGMGKRKPFLVAEISERQSSEVAMMKKHLRPLVDAGFRIAVDDFGSGAASFMYLAELPVHFLKIEGWMVRRIVSDRRVRQLIGAIATTAQSLKVHTVAECVENAETAQVLCDLGVDWAQGYFFAKPVLEGECRERVVKVA